MAIGLMQERPPFIRFEIGTVEDRNASIEAGRYIARDIEMVFITPAGSKDVVEREATQWLNEVRQKARQSPPMYNPQWVAHFDAVYKAWKDGQELPVNGTPIRTWSVLSPAQIQNLVSARVLTVEDLAAANEETLRTIGMGSRDLKAKALAFLEQARDGGAIVAKVAAQEVELETLREKVEEQSRIIAQLMADLDQRTEPKGRRSLRERADSLADNRPVV